jgi:hypothetical protein
MSPVRTSPVRTTIAIAAAALAAAVALTGCANQQAGSAATLGDSRITETTVSDQVQDILAAKGQPVTSVDATLPSEVLRRIITTELVDRVAADNGIVITQGQIDEQYANYEGQTGDQAAVEKLFIEQGIAPSQIESILRLNLQAQAIGIALDPQGSAEQQGQAVLDAVVKKSDELDVTVSPRFGTWDGAAIKVGPVPNDLSTPPTAS